MVEINNNLLSGENHWPQIYLSREGLDPRQWEAIWNVCQCFKPIGHWRPPPFLTQILFYHLSHFPLITIYPIISFLNNRYVMKKIINDSFKNLLYFKNIFNYFTESLNFFIIIIFITTTNFFCIQNTSHWQS